MGLGVYYLRPVLRSLTRKKAARVVAKSTAPQPVPQRFTGQGLAEVRVKSEVVDESTPWGRNPFLTEEEEARGRGGRGPAS